MKFNYNKAMKSIFSLIVICVAFTFFSCSRTEPRIVFGFIELIYYSGEERPEERFSFFILPEDDDGIENLSELYLYHDREGLRWQINSSDWVRFEDEGRTWIGSRNIAMTGGFPLPRGQFRAVLVTKGGESTERRFTFDGPIEPPHPFPVLSITDGRYVIDSRYPINHLIAYDQEGNVVQTITLTLHEGNVRDLRLSSSARSVALWAEDPNFAISALTDAVSLR